jgi:hypothetical protein
MMPVIPQYNRQIETPLTLGAPKQSINSPIEAFGGAAAKDVGAMGDTAGKLGNAMAQIVVQQKEKEDHASLNQAAKQYLDWDRDYQEGIYSVKGADANAGLVVKSKEERTAKIEELAGALRSPELGGALREKLSAAYNSGQTLAARHIRSQMEDWSKKSQAEVAQSQLDSLTDASPSLAPEEVEAGFTARVHPELEALAKLTGTPVEELVRKTKDNLFTSTVKQAIAAGDVKRANGLMERWKNDIDADTRASLTDSLRKKTIDDTAEDTAFNYYKMLKGGKISPDTAMDQIEQIENKDLRRTTRKLFDSYARQHKYDHAQAVNETIVSKISDLDGLAGNLPAQQKLVQSFAGDPKVKKQLESRLNQYKSAEGIRPMTDAEAYADATEQIISGKITAPEQIDVAFGVNVEKADREKLKTGLDQMQKMTTSSLKVAFTKANGIEGGAEASLKGSKKKNFGEFMLWAGEKVKETNRAQEPEYFQKLADMWVLKGESKGGGMLPASMQKFVGVTDYGENMTFQDAVKAGKGDTWLPSMPDKTTASQVAEVFAQHPTVKAKWLEKYGNEELAARAYYKAVLMQGIGPRSK